MEPVEADADFNAALAYHEGDSWPGIYGLSVEIEDADGAFAPPASALDKIIMQFWLQTAGSPIALTLQSPGTADITDAPNWEGDIPQRVLTLQEGIYNWAIKMISADGTFSQTLFRGVQTVKRRLINLQS